LAVTIREKLFRTEVMFYDALREVLYSIDCAASEPSQTHRFLRFLNAPHVVTTNYDSLIERFVAPTYAKVTGFDSVALNYYSSLSPDRPVIFKIHGDLHRPDTIPFSEPAFQDLYKATGPLSGLLDKIFKERCVLFLGTSLGPSERYIVHLKDALRRAKESSGPEHRHFALLRRSDASSKSDTLIEHDLSHLGVKPIWYDKDKDHSHVWEFLSLLAQNAPEIGSTIARVWRRLYGFDKRDEYLLKQCELEERATCVTFVTPKLTNAIGSEEFIQSVCIPAFRAKLRDSLRETGLVDRVSIAMIQRRKNLYRRMREGSLHVRVLFRRTELEAEMASDAAVRETHVQRYRELVELASIGKLEFRLIDGAEHDGRYQRDSYALIVVPRPADIGDIVVAYAAQATSNYFETQMIERNTEAALHFAAQTEALWWNAMSSSESAGLVRGRIAAT
jgi:hypothetical protein